jgi:hypothetical protein
MTAVILATYTSGLSCLYLGVLRIAMGLVHEYQDAYNDIHRELQTHRNTILYKEEGEVHCNSQCHVTALRVPDPASFNMVHSNGRIMLLVA